MNKITVIKTRDGKFKADMNVKLPVIQTMTIELETSDELSRLLASYVMKAVEETFEKAWNEAEYIKEL